MESYSYIAKDKQSKTKRGTIEATSREEAIKILQAQGLYVIGISPLATLHQAKTEAIRVKRFSHSKIKLMDLTMFARQLAILLSSGVTLLRSLEVVSSQCESKKLTYILQNIIVDVKKGLSLTESINKYPVFTNLWKGLVDTGEASGTLSSVLDKLASYLEMRMDFVRKLISAIIYPIILFVCATSALTFFSIFVLPKFQEIFREFQVELPALTVFMFNMTNFAREHFLWFLLAGCGVPTFLRFFTRSNYGKVLIDTMQLRMFVIKGFFSVYFLERIASTFYILFDSGVPVVYAIDVVQRSIGNSILEKTLNTVKENVKAGKSLASELACSEYFPPMVIEMVAIGEEVGDLPGMFAKVTEHYKTALTTKTERFTAMFEPLMIIFMGFVIGVVVVSLFLPMFELSRAVH